MPTVLQIVLRFFAIVSLSAFWGSLAILRIFIDWWKNRKTFFKTKKHSRPAEQLDDPTWSHCYTKVSKLQMHYVESGDPKNRLIVFLHGFPEFWYSWRYQIRYLQSQYHILALDLRGYNESDKPEEIFSYSTDWIVADVAEFIEKLSGGRKAILVGHDWGGIIAWYLAARHTSLIEKLVILNSPHPSIAMQIIRTSAMQLLKSWYIFMFQIPYLPELTFWANDYRMLDKIFRGKKAGLVNKANFTDKDLEAWKYVFSQPDALTPPINYYRAAIRSAITNQFPPFERISIPTLIIWGEKDPFIELTAAEMSLSLCTNGELKVIKNASHWVQQDVPDIVNNMIESFIENSKTMIKEAN